MRLEIGWITFSWQTSAVLDEPFARHHDASRSIFCFIVGSLLVQCLEVDSNNVLCESEVSDSPYEFCPLALLVTSKVVRGILICRASLSRKDHLHLIELSYWYSKMELAPPESIRKNYLRNSRIPSGYEPVPFRSLIGYAKRRRNSLT